MAGWSDALRDLARAVLRSGATGSQRRGGAEHGGRGSRSGPAAERPAYRGDFTGRGTVSYAPHPDGVADPGEVVWAWVPYEDDHRRGKDRPVLVVGRDGADLLGLPLTSRDHDRDAADEARYGRQWLDLGTGSWDRQGRPSEVRLDRVVRLAPDAVRREGATLDRGRFDEVAARLRASYGWR